MVKPRGARFRDAIEQAREELFLVPNFLEVVERTAVGHRARDDAEGLAQSDAIERPEPAARRDGALAGARLYPLVPGLHPQAEAYVVRGEVAILDPCPPRLADRRPEHERSRGPFEETKCLLESPLPRGPGTEKRKSRHLD